jgi:hypothetical protein
MIDKQVTVLIEGLGAMESLVVRRNMDFWWGLSECMFFPKLFRRCSVGGELDRYPIILCLIVLSGTL